MESIDTVQRYELAQRKRHPTHSNAYVKFNTLKQDVASAIFIYVPTISMTTTHDSLTLEVQYSIQCVADTW